MCQLQSPLVKLKVKPVNSTSGSVYVASRFFLFCNQCLEVCLLPHCTRLAETRSLAVWTCWFQSSNTQNCCTNIIWSPAKNLKKGGVVGNKENNLMTMFQAEIGGLQSNIYKGWVSGKTWVCLRRCSTFHIMRPPQPGATNVVRTPPRNGEPGLRFEPHQSNTTSIKTAYSHITLNICSYVLTIYIIWVRMAENNVDQSTTTGRKSSWRQVGINFNQPFNGPIKRKLPLLPGIISFDLETHLQGAELLLWMESKTWSVCWGFFMNVK